MRATGHRRPILGGCAPANDAFSGGPTSAPCWTALIADIRRGESRSLVLPRRIRHRQDGASYVTVEVFVRGSRSLGRTGCESELELALRRLAPALCTVARGAPRRVARAARNLAARRCRARQAFGPHGRRPAPERLLVGLAALNLLIAGV